MELFEAAILVVGGIWLVGHMSRKQAAVAAAPALGTTNRSNLTTITNTAGGYPTVYGESLEPPQPAIPVSRVAAMPPSLAPSVPTAPFRVPLAPVAPVAPVRTVYPAVTPSNTRQHVNMLL
jgi:hypothetical protein